MAEQEQPEVLRTWQDKLLAGDIAPAELLASTVDALSNIVERQYRSSAYAELRRSASQEEVLSGVYRKLESRLGRKVMPKDAAEWLKWMRQDCWGVGKDLRRKQLRTAERHKSILDLDSPDDLSREMLSRLSASGSTHIMPHTVLFAYASSLDLITTREREVLEHRLLDQMKPDESHHWKDTAAKLGIATDTAKEYYANAIDKIGPLIALTSNRESGEAKVADLSQYGLSLIEQSASYRLFFLCVKLLVMLYRDGPQAYAETHHSQSELRPQMEVVDGYQLIRRVSRTPNCDFWLANGPSGEKVGMKFRNHLDGAWMMDVRMMKMLDNLIQYPFFTPRWVITLCKPADRSLLDELVASQSPAHTGLDISLVRRLTRVLAHRLKLGKDLVPRNINPANLVTDGDDIWLFDHGHTTSATSLLPDSLPVTPFTSPLLATGKPDETSDQYSAAVTYYLLRTGKLPFATMPDNRSNEQPDLSMVSSEEQEILVRALHPDPKQRWPWPELPLAKL